MTHICTKTLINLFCPWDSILSKTCYRDKPAIVSHQFIFFTL